MDIESHYLLVTFNIINVNPSLVHYSSLPTYFVISFSCVIRFYLDKKFLLQQILEY